MSQKTTRREFIKQAGLAGLALGLTGAGSQFIVGCARREFDIIIKGGMVYDGLGSAPMPADVGIKNGMITAIGGLGERSTDQVIDASGRVVCPGFIDAHTHTDIGLLVNPKAESKIRQGVTTEVSGQCGDSPFPVGGPEWDKAIERIEEKYGIVVDWKDADGFLNRLAKKKSAVNFVPFLGHGTLRGVAMGIEDRAPTADEMETMKKMVRVAMEQGVFGMSSGLEYTPGSYADTDEIITLCKEMADKCGVYTTHIRSEDIRVEEALDEAIHIAREANVSLQLSHLKASQQRNWHKIPRMLETIQKAGEDGLSIHADRYTYAAWSTTLQMLLPMWSREGTGEDLVQRLKDEAQWAEIKPFMLDKVNALGSWKSVLITSVRTDENKHIQGQIVPDLAAAAGLEPAKYIRELLIQEEGAVGMVGFGMSEENTEKVLAFSRTMVGSDGNSLAPYGPLSEGNPHPRSYGAFPRFLGHYIRERKILPWPEAISRITSLPAKKYGIADRGVLAKGKLADVVVFDMDKVIDKATFTNPHQYPVGIEYVIVNGKITIEKGEHTGALAGKVIRRV